MFYSFRPIQNCITHNVPAVNDVARPPHKAMRSIAGAGNVGEGGVGMAKP